MKSTRFTSLNARTKTGWILFIAAVMLLVIGGLIAGMQRGREPVYGGKPLSAWLEDLDSQQPDQARQQATHALQQMGTNALPGLIAILRAEESPLAKLIAKVPFWRHASSEEWPSTPTKLDRRKGQAGLAFAALGTEAEPAIPELVKLLNSTNCWPIPGLALGRIGEAGVAPLMSALASPDVMVRRQAIFGLYERPSGSAAATTALLRGLGDTDIVVRVKAASALRESQNEAARVVPALIRALQDGDPNVRLSSAGALARFGATAKGALPMLKELCRDADEFVAKEAKNAVSTIEAAERD